MKSLSECFQLDACAEVVKEFIAVINGIKSEDSLKEQVHTFRFDFFDHIMFLRSAVRRKFEIIIFILYILAHYYVKVKRF